MEPGLSSREGPHCPFASDHLSCSTDGDHVGGLRRLPSRVKASAAAPGRIVRRFAGPMEREVVRADAAAALFVATLAAFAANGDTSRDHELEAPFVAAIDGERLLRTVRELVALGPRMGGTPSGEAAAKYHEARFRAAGLEPQSVVDPPLRAFQPLSLAAQLAVGEESLKLVDGTLALRTKGIAACELPLYRDADLAAAGERYALWIDAAELRAIRWPKAPPVALLVACDARLETSTPILRQPRGYDGTVLSLSRRESAWLRERSSGGAVRLALAAEVFDQEAAPRTVWADVPGATPDAPIVLFCAHGDSDSGGPGADDNASGDAVVHELAAAFAQLARDEGMALPVTLRFVIWGAEIHSSGAWYRRIQQDGSARRHAAVINFDQAGTGAERDCIYFEPDDVKRNEPLIRAGLAVGGDYGGDDGFWSEWTSNAALGGTDSYVFSPGWRSGGGKEDLPAITIFSAAFGKAEEPAATPGFASSGWRGDTGKVRIDYSRVYHETGDTPANTTELEPWNMAWVAKAAGLLGLRLAGDPEAVAKLLDR